MRRAAVVLAVLVTILLLAACGAETSNGGGGNPDATPTPPPGGDAQVIEVQVLDGDAGLEPRVIELEAGEPYRVAFTNNGRRPHAFVAHRWRIDEFARPGDTIETEVFSEDTPGTYPCHEKMDAGRNPEMKCEIVVQ